MPTAMLATVDCTGPDMALELQNKPAPQARNHPIAAAVGIAKPVDVGEPQSVVAAVDSEDQVIQVRQANPVDVGPCLFPEPVHCFPVRRDQGQKRLAPTQSAPAVKGMCIPMRSGFHQAPGRGSVLPGQLHIGKQSLTGSRYPHLGVCQGYFLLNIATWFAEGEALTGRELSTIIELRWGKYNLGVIVHRNELEYIALPKTHMKVLARHDNVTMPDGTAIRRYYVMQIKDGLSPAEQHAA